MFNSIRAKLTLWYTCLLALMIVAFAVVSYSLFVRALDDGTNENLSEMANNLVAGINEEQRERDQPRTADQVIITALDEFRFYDYQFAVFSSDGRLVAKTSEKELPVGSVSPTSSDAYQDQTVDDEPYRMFELPFSFDQRDFSLIAFHSLADQIALEIRLQRILLILAPLLLFSAAIGGYVLARKGLRPISDIGEHAKRITAANLHERLPERRNKDEVSALAMVFNELLNRLDHEFGRQRRFMADASHELRTPLAIIRGESEVALSRDTRTAAEYRESLGVVNDESKRLTEIVNDLLTLARADSGELKPKVAELYLDELIADCVQSTRTLADTRGVSIYFKGIDSEIKGDEGLLRRLFLNIIDNAVKYNHSGGRVRVSVTDHEVKVANTGDIIPAEQRDLIFERFYRVERSRTTSNAMSMSGAGLGLSIAKWIADLHNAEIVYSRSGEDENVFTVTFPR